MKCAAASDPFCSSQDNGGRTSAYLETQTDSYGHLLDLQYTQQLGRPLKRARTLETPSSWAAADMQLLLLEHRSADTVRSTGQQDGT